MYALLDRASAREMSRRMRARILSDSVKVVVTGGWIYIRVDDRKLLFTCSELSRTFVETLNEEGGIDWYCVVLEYRQGTHERALIDVGSLEQGKLVQERLVEELLGEMPE